MTTTLTTGLIPRISLALSYGKRVEDNKEQPQEKASIGTDYTSSQECWGWKFLWTKPFEEKDWHGNYYFALVVNFFKHKRQYGNMASRYNS